jgi:hypothetical protein
MYMGVHAIVLAFLAYPTGKPVIVTQWDQPSGPIGAKATRVGVEWSGCGRCPARVGR